MYINIDIWTDNVIDKCWQIYQRTYASSAANAQEKMLSNNLLHSQANAYFFHMVWQQANHFYMHEKATTLDCQGSTENIISL